METNFLEIKNEILKRAGESGACISQTDRAIASETVAALMQVVKDNFSYSCFNKIIDRDFIIKFKEEFNRNDIFCNESRESGYLLIADCDIEYVRGNAMCNVRDNGTVQNVRDNGTVQNVWDNGTVQNVRGNGVVQDVRGNGVVRNVWGNGVVISHVRFECELHDKSILIYRHADELIYSDSKLKIEHYQ